jgi:hypothetical protein
MSFLSHLRLLGCRSDQLVVRVHLRLVRLPHNNFTKKRKKKKKKERDKKIKKIKIKKERNKKIKRK